MANIRLEELHLSVIRLAEELSELPALEREAAATPLLQRLEDELAEVVRSSAGTPDPLEALQRRELVRLVRVAAAATGDESRWRPIVDELRGALDALLLSSSASRCA